jgi:ABC-type lipoprotein release transport system permease subunit
MTLAAGGIVAGIGASLGAVTILALAAAAGCYFPARRATRVGPAMVLREE